MELAYTQVFKDLLLCWVHELNLHPAGLCGTLPDQLSLEHMKGSKSEKLEVEKARSRKS